MMRWWIILLHSDRAIFIWNDGRIISCSLTSFFAFVQYFSTLQVFECFFRKYTFVFSSTPLQRQKACISTRSRLFSAGGRLRILMKWNIFVAHKLYFYKISYSNKNYAVYMFSTVTMPHREVSHFSLVCSLVNTPFQWDMNKILEKNMRLTKYTKLFTDKTFSIVKLLLENGYIDQNQDRCCSKNIGTYQNLQVSVKIDHLES